MNGVAGTPRHKRGLRLQVGPWAWILAAGWSVAILASLGWNIHLISSNTMEQARGELRSLFVKGTILRQWASRHGGVYVPVSDTVRPDPYLRFLPERDIETPSGKHLTLLNPATLLRQFYEMGQAHGAGAYGHLSSLSPLNPENTPDPWEAEALRRLAGGETEVTAVSPIEGVPHLRLIRPMLIEQPCLKCHAKQGYGAGDVAGGISASIPLTALQEQANERMLSYSIGHGLLWLLGLFGIRIGHHQLNRRVEENRRAYRVIEENEERTRTILATALDAIITIDDEGRICDWNHQAEVIFGWRAGEVHGMPLSETIIPARYREDHVAGFERFKQSGSGPMLGRRIETLAIDRNGREFPVELAIAPTHTGGQLSISAFIRDISERKHNEEKIQRDYHSQRVLAQVLDTSMQPAPFEERLERILEHILSTPWLSLQAKGMIFVAEPEVESLRLAASKGVGDAVAEGCTLVPYGDCLCGRAAREQRLIHASCIDAEHDRHFPGMKPHGHYTLPILSEGQLLGVLNLYIDDGHERLAEEVQFLTAISHTLGAMIQRHQAEEKLRQNAYYDLLTLLPNRSLFLDRLDRCIKRSDRNPDYMYAVLFLDLDRFKNVNDSLGHTLGDQLLQAIARRLQACMRPGDTVARLGGDEFTVLLDGIAHVTDASHIAMRIHEVMDKPFELEGHEIYTSASIGIAVSDGLHYEYATELLRDADTAMFRAKQHGSGQTEVFDETMHDRAVVLLRTETELRHAIEREEICVYYQPIYNVEGQTLAGFEALARWQHPQRGLVPPDQFIPVAEETGLITDIGRQVLRQACQQLQQWNTGHPEQTPLFVSVNLSAKQFLHHNLVQEVDTILAESGLDASRLRLEITESVLLENPDETLEILQALRSRGIQLYIDDFGTGYSSLSYLHSFPFDALKIDRSFVSKLELDERHHGIVQAIVAIARHLGMNTIAEGIETESQLEWIRQLGCGHAQGFLFSPPLPADQASSLIQSGSGYPN